MYYVYEWFIVATGEVIYVGKGTRNRYKVRKHNRFFDDMISRNDCKSRIVKEFQSEKDAFEYEFERINELKKIGQCVCNIDRGGFGGSTAWWNDERRHEYSEFNVMKSETQRKRMSAENPMRDKAIAKKTSEQKQRAVIIGDIRYPSIKDAMAKYGVCYDTIASWCRKGINRLGLKCRFEDSEQVVFTDKRYNKGGCRAMTYLNASFESPIDCSKEFGIPISTLYSYLKRGFDIKGNPCRYDDDKRELVFEYPFKGKKGSAVIINDTKYNSVNEAAKALGVAKTTLYAYLQGRRKSNKYICTYDNQQPSCENTDNSITEGSTTNG